MKNPKVLFSVVLASLLLSSAALGQPPPNRRGDRAEHGANVVKRADDVHDRADDRHDRAAIISIANEWKSAVARHDRAAEQSADGRLAGWLSRELAESRRELGEDSREQGRSRRERNRSRNEAAHSPRGDDTHDLRDDRRDLRDDRRDTRRSAADLSQTIAIAEELQRMQPAFAAGTADLGMYSRKSGLLDQLVAMANAEHARDRQETREDRRETREDRHERAEPPRRRQ